MELEDLRKLFKEQKAVLIESYKAEGGGIGKDAEGFHVVLYTSDRSLLAASQPHMWKGVRIVFKEIGKLTPL